MAFAVWAGLIGGYLLVARTRHLVPGKENFAVSREFVDHGVKTRVDLAQQAVAMWRQHPWFGAGLGSFWRAQQSRQVDYAFVNHSTLLWLASETGIVGVSVFLAGVLASLVALVRRVPDVALAGGVLGMLCVVMAASIGTEVMYQRYTWCFMGAALALASRHETRASQRAAPADVATTA